MMSANFLFCPNCRSSEFDFTDNHRFQCHDCGFVYFHNIASAVGGLLKFDGRYLLLKRGKNPKKGFLDVPGGFVDQQETGEMALSRELFEETGIKTEPENWSYLASFPNDYHYKYMDYRTLDLFFTIELQSPPSITLEKNEVTEFVWLSLKEIDLEEIAFVSIKNMFKVLKEKTAP